MTSSLLFPLQELFLCALRLHIESSSLPHSSATIFIVQFMRDILISTNLTISAAGKDVPLFTLLPEFFVPISLTKVAATTVNAAEDVSELILQTTCPTTPSSWPNVRKVSTKGQVLFVSGATLSIALFHH
jgi:hypothetical protein